MHQYVQRHTSGIVDESLLADRVIRFLYSSERENPSLLQRALATPKVTEWLAHWEFDRHLSEPAQRIAAVVKRLSINTSEILGGTAQMRTLRDLFERKIRYWDARPLPEKEALIVSPADGKALPFAANVESSLPIKEKFIGMGPLLADCNPWGDAIDATNGIAGVVVRLTPDVYHYTHAPVSGHVISHRSVEGAFHSCNPIAATRLLSSYPRNRRTVTVYDTDVQDGTGVGIVVQADVAAMMIGQIVSCYSALQYDNPMPLRPGMWVERGSPVSLFRPGSSTSIVLWKGSRAAIASELIANSERADLRSRFSDWLQTAWVETALRVRQPISESTQGR